jgi:hypothetical protein
MKKHQKRGSNTKLGKASHRNRKIKQKYYLSSDTNGLSTTILWGNRLTVTHHIQSTDTRNYEFRIMKSLTKHMTQKEKHNRYSTHRNDERLNTARNCHIYKTSRKSLKGKLQTQYTQPNIESLNEAPNESIGNRATSWNTICKPDDGQLGRNTLWNKAKQTNAKAYKDRQETE